MGLPLTSVALLKHIFLVFLLCILPVAPQASAQEQSSTLRVVATLGILGDLAQQVGGEHVQVQVLSSPRQDPHYVQPRPTLMRKAREADVFLQVGLQLELWADKVVSGSGNPRIQSGQPGNVIVSSGVPTLELPSVLSREWGDVHPYGNPHIWLDPVNTKIMAANIAKAFVALDPAHAESYRANLTDFEGRLDLALFGPELIKKFGSRKLTRLARGGQLFSYLERRGELGLLGGWMKKAQPLRGKPFVSYHKTFVYLASRFGLVIPIEVEDKPGIPPTAKHKQAVLQLMRERKVGALLQEIFFDSSAAEYLCEHTEANLAVVPIDVGAEVEVNDIFGLIDLLLEELLEAHGLATN
ncbi:MAG: zinc/manganese transport system substrate-binding protein [Planctomycetota bacterium]